MKTRFEFLWFLVGLLVATAGWAQAQQPYLESFQRTSAATIAPGTAVTIDYSAYVNPGVVSGVVFRYTDQLGGWFHVVGNGPAGTASKILPTDAVGGAYRLDIIYVYTANGGPSSTLSRSSIGSTADFTLNSPISAVTAPTLTSLQRTSAASVGRGSAVTIAYTALGYGREVHSVQFRYTDPNGGWLYVTGNGDSSNAGKIIPGDAVPGPYRLDVVFVYFADGSSGTTLYRGGGLLKTPSGLSGPDTHAVAFAPADFSVTSASASLSAPVITRQLTPQTVTVGQSVTFQVLATGVPSPTYQWKKGGVALGGTTTDNAYPISVTTPADAGAYTVTVTNSQGSVTSNPAILVVDAPLPAILAGPLSVTVVANERVPLRVSATGTGILSYQWYRGPSGTTTTPVAGATSATFFTPPLTETTSYWVRITDSYGATDSPAATITISGASPLTVAQSVMGRGYMAGGAVTVTNTIFYTGAAPSRIDWATLLPPGWKYIASGGSEGAARPQFNAPDLAEWSWTTVPPSPITFVYTLSVPPGVEADQVIASIVTSRAAGTDYQTMAKPDPLVLRTASLHSADSNRDRKIGLLELTRVIELYNYRSGTVRTGIYRIETGTEDGFAPGP